MAVFSGNGAVGSPSFTFSSDTDTGMYRGAENQIFFSAGGARNFYIRDTEAGSDVPFIGFDQTGPAITSRVGTSTNTTTSVTTNALLLRDANSRMNGTSYTTGGLDIRNALAFAFLDTGTNQRVLATVLAKNTQNVTGGAVKPKADLVFQTNDGAGNSLTLVDRVQITNSGSLFVGGTLPASPNVILGSNGNVYAANVEDTSGYWAVGFDGISGNYQSRSNVPLRMGASSTSGSATQGVQLSVLATSWSTWSDERYKTDLKPITDGLQKVSSLRAVTGRYKSDPEELSRSFLIAQDVQAVLPEAVDVSQADAEDTLGLRYTEVIPLLVSALHDAKDRIETLEAEVAALKGA